MLPPANWVAVVCWWWQQKVLNRFTSKRFAMVHTNNDDLGPYKMPWAGSVNVRGAEMQVATDAFPSSYSGIYDTAIIITASIKFY